MISLQGTRCVKFTPKQYIQLYNCGLLYADDVNLNTTSDVIESFVNGTARTWNRNVYKILTNYKDTKQPCCN